jgi:iron complex outermembrane receptor protein
MSADGKAVEYLRWFDPLVPEEKAINYEVGTTLRSGNLAVAVNGYWMDVDNEIVPFGGLYLSYPVKASAERTVHRGLELELNAQLAGRHRLVVTASRSWDEFDRFIYLDEGEAVDAAGNRIALFPEYLATILWRANWGKVDSGVRFRAAGRQFLDNTGQEGRSLEPYEVLDLRLGADLAELLGPALAGARLDFRVRNVLDEEYETNGYYLWDTRYSIPAAKRNFLVGVAYDF